MVEKKKWSSIRVSVGDVIAPAHVRGPCPACGEMFDGLAPGPPGTPTKLVCPHCKHSFSIAVGPPSKGTTSSS